MKTAKTLITSISVIVICFTMLIGTTFAWFTDSVVNTNNIIKSGNVDIELYHKLNGAGEFEEVNGETKLFLNKDQKEIVWEPGASTTEEFKIVNAGTLALKYEFRIKALAKTTTPDGKSLADILTLSVKGEEIDNTAVFGDGYTFESSIYAIENENYENYTVNISWDKDAQNNNDFNVKDGLKIYLGIELVATQLSYESDGTSNGFDDNAQYPNILDEWDGTSDVSWYLGNEDEDTYLLSTAEAFAGFADLVNGTATISTFSGESVSIEQATFENKSIVLTSNVDLAQFDEDGNKISFAPIGSYAFKKEFKGTFDGNGYTISNLYQNGWELGSGLWDGDDCGLGLFGMVRNATIKNVVIDNASFPSECNLIGAIAGAAYGNCIFENITVSNTYIGNHSYYSGGLVGWASGNHKYINCDVTADTVISSQWGDFNNSNGGIIGGAGSSGTYYFEDCDVACVLDVYNDVTSAYLWYTYRNSGMLIGNTNHTQDIDGTVYAVAPNVTCKNVTVTYGSWANYHYCEFSSASYPWCRVEAGESTSAYGNARVSEYKDANGNVVVDDNHVHNEGEAHNELIVFDQLFGGPSGDRYCTYGNPSHEGVTVIYNNK